MPVKPEVKARELKELRGSIEGEINELKVSLEEESAIEGNDEVVAHIQAQIAEAEADLAEVVAEQEGVVRQINQNLGQAPKTEEQSVYEAVEDKVFPDDKAVPEPTEGPYTIGQHPISKEPQLLHNGEVVDTLGGRTEAEAQEEAANYNEMDKVPYEPVTGWKSTNQKLQTEDKGDGWYSITRPDGGTYEIGKFKIGDVEITFKEDLTRNKYTATIKGVDGSTVTQDYAAKDIALRGVKEFLAIDETGAFEVVTTEAPPTTKEVVSEAPVTYEFVGIQEGFKDKPDVALYNIMTPEHPNFQSTITLTDEKLKPGDIVKGGPFEGKALVAEKPDEILIRKNAAVEIDRISKVDVEAEDGVTLNVDGTKYEGGGLSVSIDSKNLKQSQLTLDSFMKFVKKNEGKLPSKQLLKFGLYKFGKRDQVSTDLNVVIDSKHRDVAIEFARLAGQESIFDLDKGVNVKTGASGENPVVFTDAEFSEISSALSEGKLPKFLTKEAGPVKKREILYNYQDVPHKELSAEKAQAAGQIGARRGEETRRSQEPGIYLYRRGAQIEISQNLGKKGQYEHEVVEDLAIYDPVTATAEEVQKLQDKATELQGALPFTHDRKLYIERAVKALGYDGYTSAGIVKLFTPVSGKIKKLKRDITTAGEDDLKFQRKSTKAPAGLAITDVTEDISFLPSKSMVDKQRVFDLALSLNNRSLEIQSQHGVDLTEMTEESRGLVAQVVADEILGQYKRDDSAIGWYSEAVDKAVDIMAEIHPKIKSDPIHREAFTVALAITSIGNTVGYNLELAEAVYARWADEGKMPEDLGDIGPKRDGIIKGLKGYNELVEDSGVEAAHRFLMGKFKTRALRKAGALVSGESQDQVVLGASIFGPKVGAYYGALSGDYEQLVMDLWFVRTMGRIRGTLTPEKPSNTQRIAFIKAYAKSKAPAQTSLFKRYTAAELRADESLAIAIADEIFAEYRRGKYKVRTKLNRAAKNYIDAVNYIQAAPVGPKERVFNRAVMEEAVALVKKEGVDLTIADAQALLWFMEKDLYYSQGASTKRTEKTDYEQEAIKLRQRYADRGRNPVIQKSVFERPNKGAKTLDKKAKKARTKKRLIKKVLTPTGETYSKADGMASSNQNVLVRKGEKPGDYLMVQISSNLMRAEATDMGQSYYDKLYQNREGYERPVDFWEVPQWVPVLNKTFPNSDFYVVRNIQEAIEFLNSQNYENVFFSAMDANKGFIKDILTDYKRDAIVGGYVDADYFEGVEGTRYMSSVVEAADLMGVEVVDGVDYSMFKGTRTIPRLQLSEGCKYKCDFCTVGWDEELGLRNRDVIESSWDNIEKQLEGFKGLKFSLVYLNDKTFRQAPNHKKLPEIFKRIKKSNPSFEGFVIQTTAGDFNKLDEQFIKDSGIKYVELGMETFNDDILKKLHKPHNTKLLDQSAEKIRKLGINYIPNVMVGLAGKNKDGSIWAETKETYQNTLDYLEKNRDIVSHVNVYVLATYEGTELGDQLGLDEDVDSDENVIQKSWLKDPALHEGFYQSVLDFGKEMLDDPALGMRQEQRPAPIPGARISEAQIEKDVDLLSKAVSGVEVVRDIKEYDRIVDLRVIKDKPLGFYDPQTATIYIDPRRAEKDTVFHEFSHPVIRYLKTSTDKHDRGMYIQGIDLIKGTEYEVAAKRDYSDLDEAGQLEEALVMAIGEKGSQIADLPAQGRFKEWLRKVMMTIRRIFKQTFGIAPTLDEFTDQLAGRIVSGKKQFAIKPRKELLQFEQGVEKPVFYSKLIREIGKAQAKAPASQWKGMIAKAGIKKEEVEWSGVMEWLDDQTGPVTKVALMDYLRANQVVVEEVVKGEAVDINYGDKYAIPEVIKVVKKYQGEAEEALLIALENDGDAYRALMKKFPGLEGNESWAVIVLDGVTGGRMGNITPTKFAQHTLPGGGNYRELLLTLPHTEKIKEDEGTEGLAKELYHKNYSELTEDEKAHLLRVYRRRQAGPPFTGGHFDEPNVLVHVRFNEREDSDGNLVLFIEEIQSDWHQEGRKKGYEGLLTEKDIEVKFIPPTVPEGGDPSVYPGFWESFDKRTGEMITRHPGSMKEAGVVEEALAIGKQIEERKIPDAPFKKTWHELALKRMLRYATENGFSKLAWTTGEQQANRYDLSKQISRVRYDDQRNLVAYDFDGREVIVRHLDSDEQLEDYIGKEPAKKLLEKELIVPKTEHRGGGLTVKEASYRELTGLDLKVGGEGMKGFYDKMVPRFLNKYVKKWGSKVEEVGLRISPSLEGLTDLKVDGPFSSGDYAILGADRSGVYRYVYHHTGSQRLFATREAAQGWLDENVKVSLTQPSIDITPAMRESVLQGQPQFQVRKRITDTPAFKKWFGGSKVVDEAGEPLVVYHGTSGEIDFDSFKRRVGDVGIHFGTAGQADDRLAYVGSRPEKRVLSKQRLIPVYLSIKNPLRLDDAGAWNADNMSWKLEERFPSDEHRIIKLITTKDIREYLQAKGYDGIVYKNTGEVAGAQLLQEKQDAALKILMESQKSRGKSLGSFDREDQQTEEYKKYNAAYDAVVRYREANAEDSYIVFERTQIKSVYNIGTFDPTDARIMKQLQKQPDQGKRLKKTVQFEGKEPKQVTLDAVNTVKAKIKAMERGVDIGKASQEKELAELRQELERLEKAREGGKGLQKTVQFEGEKPQLVKLSTATFIKDRINSLKRGQRLGASERTQELEKLKMMIQQYSRRELPKYLITRGQITPLITQVAKAQTINDVARAFERIDNIRAKVNKKAALNKFAQTINKYKPKKEHGKIIGKHLMPDEYRELSDIRKIVALELPAVEETINRILMTAEGQSRDINDLEERLVYLLGTYGDLKNKDSGQIMTALEDMNSIIETGKTVHQFLEERRRNYNAGLRKQVIDNVTGGKGELRTMEQRKQKKDKVKKRLSGLKDFLYRNQSFEYLMDILEGKDKTTGTLRGFMAQRFGNVVHEARQEENRGTREKYALIQDKMKEIFGIASARKLTKVLNENAFDRVETGIMLENGDELIITKNEAYKKWMEWQDPENTETFEKMGYTEETIQDLEKFIGPELIKWAEWQLNEFYPQYYQEINEVFKERFFIDLPQHDFYSPQQREGKEAEKEDEQLLNSTNVHASIINSSLKSRVKNTRPLKYIDGDTVLKQHVAQMEHFMAWAMPMQELRSVLGSGEVQRVINQEYGMSPVKILGGFLDDFARGGMDRSQMIKGLDIFRGNFAKAKIGLNFTVFLKQLTSFPAFWIEDIPATAFAKGIVDFWKRPIENFKILRESEWWKDRYTRGHERDIIQALEKTTSETFSGVKRSTDQMMIFTRIGDGVAIVVGGWSIYKHYYDNAIKGGKSVTEAKRVAMNRFERASKRTQQSGDIQDLGAIQRGGSWPRLFTLFMTATNQYFRAEAGAVRALAKGRGSKAQNIKVIMVTHFILPMLFQFVANGFKWREKKQLRAILVGSLNGVLILGDIIEMAVDALVGNYIFEQEAATPFSIAGEIGDLFKALRKAFVDEELDLETIINIADKAAVPVSTYEGIPYQPGKRLATGWYDYLTGETDISPRLLGFSDWALGDQKKKKKSGSKTLTRKPARNKSKRKSLTRKK